MEFFSKESGKESQEGFATTTIQEIIESLKNSEREDQQKIGKIMEEQNKKGGVTAGVLMVAARSMGFHIPSEAEVGAWKEKMLNGESEK